jgi:molybdate transport system substrate-binding protein
LRVCFGPLADPVSAGLVQVARLWFDRRRTNAARAGWDNKGDFDMRRRCILLALAMLGSVAAARADTITVVSSGGFAAAYTVLVPEFEKRTGHKVVSQWGPSMGTTTDAVPQRLARHEDIDVVIMVGYALDKLAADGKAIADSKVALAQSGIGIVVKQGSKAPDVSTVDALRKALLAAKSVAYSDSASGVYIEREMFDKMGIKAEMNLKAKMIPAVPVGSVVASGEYEIGFQQVSELKPIKGITLIGQLPGDLQKITVFSAGVVTGSKHEAAARALIDFLAQPANAAVIKDSGMEPLGHKAK